MVTPEAAKAPRRLHFDSILDPIWIKIDQKINVVFRTGFWRLAAPNFEEFLVVFSVIYEVKSDATTVAKRRFAQLKIMKTPCNSQLRRRVA